jgi:hypothetical protein
MGESVKGKPRSQPPDRRRKRQLSFSRKSEESEKHECHWWIQPRPQPVIGWFIHIVASVLVQMIKG